MLRHIKLNSHPLHPWIILLVVFTQYYEVQLGSNLESHSVDRRTLVPTNWAPSNFSDVVFVWKFSDMMWGQRVSLINFVDPAKHLLGLPQAQTPSSITPNDSGHCPPWRVATSCDQTKLDPAPKGGVLGRSGVCSTFPSSTICFGLRPHAPAARQPCQNLTTIHTHQLWFPLLLLTVLRGWHLFWNKRGPCIFTQGWGQGAAEGVRHWTCVCFTFVYQHFRLVCIPPADTYS